MAPGAPFGHSKIGAGAGAVGGDIDCAASEVAHANRQQSEARRMRLVSVLTSFPPIARTLHIAATSPTEPIRLPVHSAWWPAG
jgi:hypothetical protein